MMHSTRRRIIAVASLALIASALVSCSSSGSASGKTTIRVSNWDGGISKEVVAAFEKEHPDINVDVLLYPDDYSQKITTMITGGKAPDVMLLWEEDYARFSKSGVLEPLKDYIAKSDVATDDFIPAVNELAATTGGTYGLPWCYASELLFYNKDLFDAAGVSYPTDAWTWDDFRQAAVKLTGEQDGQTVWGTDAITQGGIWYSMAGEAGDKVLDDKGKLSLGDGLKKALEFQNQLTHEDKVSPEPSTGDSVSDLFAAGRAAMTRSGSWSIGTYREAPFNWDVVPLPAETRDYTTLHTGFYTINAKSGKDKKDAAWTFINFMMSKDGQALTSESTSNPSAIAALASSDSWQHGGPGGPTNWGAIATSGETGSFGYTLAPSTVSTNLVEKFNSYLLGATSLDEVLKSAKDAEKDGS
jgi:multiple sugar transport system substrate-binding protein